MIRIGNVVAGLATLSLLGACGGGSTSAPVVVALTPTSVAAIDGGESTPLVATVTPDAGGQAVQWTVTCPVGVASCGGMAQATSVSGAPDNFQSDAGTSATSVVTVTATSIQDSTKSVSVQVPVNPMLRAGGPAGVLLAVVGTPFALQIPDFTLGGTPPLNCTVTSGGLPAGLGFDAPSATVKGSPLAAAPAIRVGFGCTDSASPPTSLPTELQVSLQVLTPPGIVPFNMAYQRVSHTATLLPTGFVLVAGGDGSGATAELYEPNTGVFGPTGAMASARRNHTATLLKTGRVLIAGGEATAPGAAELYDSTIGRFTATGRMTDARTGHTATRLANGNVLLVGGTSPAGNVLASAEIYDPGTGIFTAAGGLATARTTHAAVLLGDGRVLIAGGSDGQVRLATAEVFDPTTGRFTPTGAMLEVRSHFTATVVTGGQVLVTGGWGPVTGASLASAELFDPATGRFAQTGSMGTPRADHTATERADGSVLVTGGNSVYAYDPYICGGQLFSCGRQIQTTTPYVEVFDPATGTFTAAQLRIVGRAAHTATLLASGAVLVTGGHGVDYAGYHVPYRIFPATASAQQAL